jgi:hypothetical protein
MPLMEKVFAAIATEPADVGAMPDAVVADAVAVTPEAPVVALIALAMDSALAAFSPPPTPTTDAPTATPFSVSEPVASALTVVAPETVAE